MTTPPTDLRRRTSALMLVGGWALFFLPQILSRGVPFRRDMLMLHLPIRQFIHESLKAGALPHWYPYEGLGVPFIGQIITATFHPQTLLFLPFAPPLALKLNVLLAYLFGAAGAYKLARGFQTSRLAALAGAATLSFGGYALSMSDNLPYLVGLMTLPWVGWAASRVARFQRMKDVSLLAVAWALLFLGGDAQSFALAPLLMLAVAMSTKVRPKLLVHFGVAAVLATLLCAVELLPALSVYSDSARFAGQTTIDFGTFWALHPMRTLEFLTPGFLPADQRVEIGKALFGQPFVWSMSIFAGGITLLLAGAGATKRTRASWAMLAFTLVGLWLSLGSRGGLHLALTRLIPPFGMFRFPEKFLALFWVGLVPLVAFGLDVVRDAPARWMRLTIAAGVVVLLGMLVVPALEQHAGVELPWRFGLLTTAVFLVIAGLMLARPRAAVLMPALMLIELWMGNVRHFTLVDPALVSGDAAPFAAAVRGDPSRGLAPPRIVNVSSPSAVQADTPEAFEAWTNASMTLLRPDTAGLAHVSVMGHSTMPAFGGRSRLLYGPNGARDEQFSSLLGACYRTTSLSPRLQVGDEVVAARPSENAALVRQPCRAQAALASTTSVENAEAAFSALSAGLPDRTVIWENAPTLTSAQGSVEWLEWQPNRARLLVEAPAATALVWSESFSAGWSADVDGQRTEIVPTNVVAMGLPIEAGKHTLTFTYRTPRFAAGLVTSLVGLLLSAALLVRRRPAA